MKIMIYDVREKREETLNTVKRKERNGCLTIIIFVTLVYIGISCGVYKEKFPELSITDVFIEHFFDAVLWNHELTTPKK